MTKKTKPKTLMTEEAVKRIKSATATAGDGKNRKKSFAARAERAVSKRNKK